MTLTLTSDDRLVSVYDGDVELFRYTFVPDSPQFESPKPYLHPIRTRAGHVVSLFRPHDHVWHKGIAWSLPVVGEENFWGGPTFVRDRGYVQLPNDGSQTHREIDVAEVGDDGVARFAHRLEWITESGERLFTERREITARVRDAAGWMLGVTTAMTNVSASPIAIGSPTTRGRENAGYGGLFWRGPRSFTDGLLVTVDGTAPGEVARGQRHEWMGYIGRLDEVDAEALVLMVDHTRNPQHPPQWFARSEEFACLNPAPFFSDELTVAPGEEVVFRYGVGIADAAPGGASTAAVPLAEAVRGVLAAGS